MVLVIEDDSHISRLLRNHFEKAFSRIRVEIAGSPSKAKMICEKFNPQIIVWDGQPNCNGTREEYATCIPDALWPRVIPICTDDATQNFAKEKGAHPCLPKPNEALNAWADILTDVVKKLIEPVKARK